MIDLGPLLIPVSDVAPCGNDLSFSAEFDAIQAARQFDDPSLDQGEWVTTLKVADWRFVVDQCSTLLTTHTKDIRLAVWLTEAWCKTAGYAALGSGFDLLSEFCERYWDSLYPLAEDGDQEQRIGNLAWLLTRTEQLVREQPLTQSSQNGQFSLLDQRRLANPVLFESARQDTPRDFYVRLLDEITACKLALNRLQKNIDGKLGDAGPSFSKAREAFDDVLHLVQRLAQESGVVALTNAVGAPPTTPTVNDTANGNDGEIRTRVQALEQLLRVADFFRRTEPHSPVAYLAETAVRWGDMPLHIWLRTVLKDGTALTQVEELLGMQNDPSKR